MGIYLKYVSGLEKNCDSDRAPKLLSLQVIFYKKIKGFSDGYLPSLDIYYGKIMPASAIV